jgi:hypothetical protein
VPAGPRPRSYSSQARAGGSVFIEGEEGRNCWVVAEVAMLAAELGCPRGYLGRVAREGLRLCLLRWWVGLVWDRAMWMILARAIVGLGEAGLFFVQGRIIVLSVQMLILGMDRRQPQDYSKPQI